MLYTITLRISRHLKSLVVWRSKRTLLHSQAPLGWRIQGFLGCNTCISIFQRVPSWCFQIFLIFISIFWRFPFWLIFFNWVETTNQVLFCSYRKDDAGICNMFLDVESMTYFSLPHGKLPPQLSANLSFKELPPHWQRSQIPGLWCFFLVLDSQWNSEVKNEKPWFYSTQCNMGSITSWVVISSTVFCMFIPIGGNDPI